MALETRGDPISRPWLRKAPAHPAGERVLVIPKPDAKTTAGGIHKPDAARERNYAGRILTVGDQAADKLYDIDYRIGDEVWFGKFAGVVENWEHMIADGNQPGCAHDGAWDRVPQGSDLLGESTRDPRWNLVQDADDDMTMAACRACGALRLTQRVVGLMVDDIVCNVDAQQRLEAGITKRRRDFANDGSGRTRYVIDREPGFVDTFETGV